MGSLADGVSLTADELDELMLTSWNNAFTPNHLVTWDNHKLPKRS